MVLVTLIGEKQAKIGNRFYYMGPLAECKECPRRNVCFNLDAGSLYEIMERRDAHHNCEIFDGGASVVVVEKRSVPVCVPKKVAIDGSTITFTPKRCDQIGCKHWFHCHPLGLKEGNKAQITEVIDDVTCPIGEQMVLVKLG